VLNYIVDMLSKRNWFLLFTVDHPNSICTYN